MINAMDARSNNEYYGRLFVDDYLLIRRSAGRRTDGAKSVGKAVCRIRPCERPVVILCRIHGAPLPNVASVARQTFQAFKLKLSRLSYSGKARVRARDRRRDGS